VLERKIGRCLHRLLRLDRKFVPTDCHIAIPASLHIFRPFSK
jgi:hypothetical protein